VVVDFATVASPPGSKGLTGIDVGSLVVHLSDSAVLVALAGVLREWVRRVASRKVTVRTSDDEKSIEIDGASRQDVADALKDWASSHEHQ
jgi:Effector Associated Constant Component 1